MKNLKDYLGKKVAIACRTDDEAKFVNDFLANNGGRSLYSDWENRKNKNKEYHNCLEFGLDDLPYNCYCYEGFYKEQGYDVYEASEFIEHNTSLVGRYFKALVENAESSAIIKGNYYKIVKDYEKYFEFFTEKYPSLTLNLRKINTKNYELMPIGFNPNELLKEFPSEGCVYDNIKNLEPLTKYLLNRPFNNPNTEINKSDAIGIGWNKTSCWWLKTKESKKTLFNLSDLKQFLPNVIQEEPFAIQLNSQEELDAIMSFYKEKGYKMCGSSDYYRLNYKVEINPINKTWYTWATNADHLPLKTLSEIGITVNTKKDTNPEFIVGKWYDFDNPDYVGKSYAKFLKLSKDDEYEYFHFSEYIGNQKYDKYKGDWFSSNCTKKLTDLSEIQQYLPKGHPDKIVNNNSMYKVGDYLTVLSRIEGNSNIDDVIKITSIEKENYKGNGKNTNWVNYLNIQTKNTGAFRLEAFTNSLRKAKLEEIKTDLLSEDELLEAAKQFYPVGTKFRTIYGDNKTGTVKFNDANYFKKHRTPLNITVTVEEYEENCPKWSIHSKEKGWAKIINSSIQESDNFVLPEKWFVCPKNEENLKLVKNHFNNFYDYKITYKDNAYTYDGIYHTHASDTRDCVEITFEQFKKYVLGKSEVMEKSWTEVSLDMMQKSLTTSYPLTPDECYTSKNLLNPEIIPIKVRNLPKFETPTRVKTVIIEPELLKI